VLERAILQHDRHDDVLDLLWIPSAVSAPRVATSPNATATNATVAADRLT